MRPLRLVVYTLVAAFSLAKHRGRAEVRQDRDTILVFSTCGKAPESAQRPWRRAVVTAGLYTFSLLAFILPSLALNIFIVFGRPPQWARYTIGLPVLLGYVLVTYAYLVVTVRFERRLGRFNKIRFQAELHDWRLLSLITKPHREKAERIDNVGEDEHRGSGTRDTEERLLAELITEARTAQKGVFAFDVLLANSLTLNGSLEPVTDPGFRSWMPPLYRSNRPIQMKPVAPPEPRPARWGFLAIGFSLFGIVLLLASLAFAFLTLLYERHYCAMNPHTPNCISSYGDAVYWAITTMTTTGYGDLVPHTFVGRVYAVMLMATGLLAFGFIVSVGVSAINTGTEADERWLSHLFGVELQGDTNSDIHEIGEMLRQLLRERQPSATASSDPNEKGEDTLPG